MGDRNRITHDYSDGTLEKIMRDIDSGKIRKGGNWFTEHPAFYGTSMQQKDPSLNFCRRCAYFRRSDAGYMKKCQFPWKNPKDYDKVNEEFLPCKGRRENEKN